MGTLFRSEEMTFVQLYLQSEAAYFTIAELGESGVVQFKDINTTDVSHRKFVNEVCRCDEIERKLRYIEEILKKENIPTPDLSDLPEAPHPQKVVALEAEIEKTEDRIKELTDNVISLKISMLELTEFKLVLTKLLTFFNDRNKIALDIAIRAQMGSGEERPLGAITGVISVEKFHGFESMLWRVSRGNVFVKQLQIDQTLEDPKTGLASEKVVFAVFFQGEELAGLVQKICLSYHATLYPCPNSVKKRTKVLERVNTELADMDILLNQTIDHRRRVLTDVAKELHNWQAMILKAKAIFHTLNFFRLDLGNRCLIGECWVATSDIPIAKKALNQGAKASGSSIPSILTTVKTNEIPPTYNKTNKFTKGFQNLIDSYGMASYCEANPALYTIVTFPFLFAIMFGDVGHAIIMFLFSAVMVFYEKKIEATKINSEIFRIFFTGRYIILLMGLFSVYTGAVYNDFFSKSFNIFGTSWRANMSYERMLELPEWTMDPRFNYKGTPYIFGVDPMWQLAKNKIIFLNSYKMKLSVIFGVTHMIFGVCVSIINFLHFRQYSRIIFEFIPELCLLVFLFMWMVIMMFIKWIWYSCDKDQPVEYGSSCAPSVLIYFINMLLFKDVESKNGCNTYMFALQEVLQKGLVFMSALCIPTLLLGTPLYVKYQRSKQKTVDIEENSPKSEVEEEEEPVSEIFIHSIIHTIEYVLSTVSHTASYLRLWALSLAHSQLSEVLWSRVFSMALKFNSSYFGILTTVVTFPVWAGFTLVILIVMEGLSAFLHTLRLHWVEFMSKFYMGQGYLFHPLNFNEILEQRSTKT